MNKRFLIDKNLHSGEGAVAKSKAGGKNIIIKKNCNVCKFYKNCPKMQGKNICYGGKEIIPENQLP